MSLPSLLSYKGPFEAFFSYLEPVQQAIFSNLYAAFKTQTKPKATFDSKNSRALAAVCIQRWWLGNFCHQALFVRHHFVYRNTAKAIPLKVVHVNLAVEKERNTLSDGLKQWLEIHRKYPSDRQSPQAKAAFCANLCINVQNLESHKDEFLISYLIDSQNQIQAFCVYQTQNQTVLNLATAPQNVKETKIVGKQKVEGTGSLLLCQIFLKFKAQVIHLDSLPSAYKAYLTMGFIAKGSDELALTLNGKNRVKLIQKYGGRVLL